MLAIKLQRIGKKHQPSYRLVVAVNRSKMAAPPVEDLGSYSPKTKVATLKNDRVTYWLGVGAQPTMTVHNLLVKHGVVAQPKKAIKMKKPVVAEVTTPAAAASVSALDSTQAEEISSVVSDSQVTVDSAPMNAAAEPEPTAPAKEDLAEVKKKEDIGIELTEIKNPEA